MRHNWSGIVAIENQVTGDGRVFVDGCFRWEDADLTAETIPLRWDREDDGAHMGAVEVGRITSLERQGNGRIFGRGWIEDEWEDGAEFLTVLSAAPHGVSMDGDDYVVQVLDTTITEADATEVDSALGLAASGARRGTVMEPVVAAAGDPDPGEDAGVVVFETATGDILERWLEVRIRAVTAVDVPAFNECQITLDGQEPVAEPVDDEPADEGEEAAAAAPAVASTAPCCDACAARARAGVVSTRAALAASAGTGTIAVPIEPPAEWFQPDPARMEAYRTQAGSIRVDTDGPESGRVMGYVAPWGLCHTGYHGECVVTPTSASGYAHYATGYVVCDDGTEVATGPLTQGGGHADLMLSYRGAIEHYDNVCSAVADIAVGEDEHGIWLAGALRPGVTPEQVRDLRASGPSGDWRPVGNTLEMVAVLNVNTQGWPIVKARIASGRVQALIAGGGRARSRGYTPDALDRWAQIEGHAEARITALEAVIRAQARGRLAQHEARVREKALARLSG